MEVHLVDGTYELFRHFHALPRAQDSNGQEVAAVRGVLGSILGMIQSGATHIGVATDHVIESFRNELWSGYKTGDGIEPDLLSQFFLLEEAVTALGITVWPMVEYEADDALAAAAAEAAEDRRVERVFLCTPDKDLAQCVRDTRIVQLDRRRSIVRDEKGVVAKFGVSPVSIPDYLALVGDAADGYPGLPGWGAKSTAAVLSRFRTYRSHSEESAQMGRDSCGSIQRRLRGLWRGRLQDGRSRTGTLGIRRGQIVKFRHHACEPHDSQVVPVLPPSQPLFGRLTPNRQALGFAATC